MKLGTFYLSILTVFVLGCGAASSSSSTADNTANSNSGNSTPFQFQPSSEPYVINWEQFGEFHLASSLNVIYMGPHMNDSSLKPLSHGFTHICQQSSTPQGLANTLPSQRAILWATVGGDIGALIVGSQPWGVAMTPWNNDMSLYQYYWSNVYLKPFASKFPDSAGQETPNVDLLCSDMEKHFVTDADILAHKYGATVPADKQALSDVAYLDAYKKAMAPLYNSAHDYARAKGFQGRLTTYGEPPIRRQSWQIASKSWQEWTTNPNSDLINYLLGDYNSSDPNWDQILGPFYDSADPICPTCYYYLDYPSSKAANPAEWSVAGDYLGELLFQIEVNRVYTNKPIIQWIYLRYHVSSPTPNQWIKNHMAEATAIFPYFAGAKGIWMFDYYPGTGGAGDPTKNYSTYEYFILGLRRLSEYNFMFEGNYTPYMPTNPRDLVVQNKPVWRGIINQGKMLVAAQNPYAETNEITNLDIDYQGNTLGTIQLIGPETKLVLFNLP